MRRILITLFLISSIQLIAQPVNYTTANAHSHNDYEQAEPFYLAWRNGFGSIEADIFLQDNKLLVAHEIKELNAGNTLENLYLDPLQKILIVNKGFPYADTNKELQLLVDIKTDSVNTLHKLIEILQQYPSIIQCDKIKITISGNRPAPDSFSTYPAYIYFDGVLVKKYSAEALSKIIMLSDNFKNFSLWNGEGSIASKEVEAIKNAIKKAHAVHKKVRFWNAPDNDGGWKLFMQQQVDYINTDHIAALAKFFFMESN
jgi:alkaline phosphatase